MKGIMFFVLIALILQIVMFILIRIKRRKEKIDSVLHRYKIKSAGDAFKIMNDPTVPIADRLEIEKIYNGKAD